MLKIHQGGGMYRRNSLQRVLRRVIPPVSIFCTVAIISAFIFSFLGVSRETNQSAFADNNSTSTISLRITKGGSDVTGLDLNLSPTPDGAITKDALNLLVSTDNATGYKLDFSNADDNTAMTHTSSTVTATIPSITADTDENSFPVNSWGYSLDDITGAQTFSPIPANSAPTTLKTTSTPTTSLPNGVDQTDITFAVKADTTLPAGTYKDTVVFTAVANYVPNALEQISNMQDMTPQVCAQASVGDEAILKDTRDNKTYVVKKLADGNCWMVQNLALGGSSAITLTPADSNVTANFTLEPSSDSFGTTNDAAGININRMHDNGNTWIDSSNTVQTSGTPPSQTQYIGNYYNWYTATAGSGTYEMSTYDDNTTSSICPKGWRLPTGGAINATTGNGEFQQLYDAYGNYNSFISATSAVLSGTWSGPSAGLQGGFGSWWSSTAFDSARVYYLNFNSSDVYPQVYNISKRLGVSVRCVAAGTFNDISTMQQMTPEICEAATVGDEKILADTRDNKTYVVRKLADSKCWMVQNLRLGGSSAITLTPQDSNVIANFTLSATTNSFDTTNNAAGININRMHDNGNTWLNGSSVQTSGTPPSQTQYMGNYYNWYTATAGTGTYEMNTDGTNATSSICPKGWRLPKGGAINATTGNGEFQKLYDAYGNYNSFITATSAVLSGYWPSSSAGSQQGNSGYWQSSTAYTNIGMYGLGFDSSNVIPQNRTLDKKSGFSMRCIAEGPKFNGISTMQDMTTAICSAATIGDEKILRDTRDNNTYTVRKMEDNNCWMTQNLRLGSTSAAITLTSADSDVTSDFTIPTSAVQTSGTTSWDDTVDAIHVYNNGNSWIQPTSSGNTSTVNTSGTPDTQSKYIGNYYNWYTATASTGTYSMPGGIAGRSICPKGWKLPGSAASGSFYNLTTTALGAGNSTAGSWKLQSAPNYFALFGYYNSGASGQGNTGEWWSSTAYSYTSATTLYLLTSNVYPQNNGSRKSLGFSVRCIAR